MPRTPRTIWKGSLSFGLVNVPVGVYPATQDKTVHFNQFEEGTSDRIRYRKVNERTGEDVEQARIVRGVDVGSGDYVILSDDELAAAEPERSRAIEISDFVDLEKIDPIYYRASYYLAPEGDAATKAYALLRQAMKESNRIGVATMVMRTKEYLVAVRPHEDVLMLQTMYFADEIRPQEELPDLPNDQGLGEREVETAKMLIDAMAAEWNPDAYRDTYREKVQGLVDQKLAGHEIVTEAAPPERAPVIDLMAALNASMDRIAGGRSGAAAEEDTAAAESGSPPRPAAKSTRSTRAKAAPAKKTPAKKSASSGAPTAAKAEGAAPAAKRRTAKAPAAKAPAKSRETRRRAS